MKTQFKKGDTVETKKGTGTVIASALYKFKSLHGKVAEHLQIKINEQTTVSLIVGQHYVKKIAVAVCMLMLFCTSAFAQPLHAMVNQQQGLYVFIFSAPTQHFETLGTVQKTGITFTNKPRELFNIICRRAKRNFPTGNAIIFDDITLKHATVIRITP